MYSAFPSEATEEITTFVPKESSHMFIKVFSTLKKYVILFHGRCKNVSRKFLRKLSEKLRNNSNSSLRTQP